MLGQKLKKDAQKVKKALPGLTSEQVKEFVKTKEMVVDGIKVTDEDLTVSLTRLFWRWECIYLNMTKKI